MNSSIARRCVWMLAVGLLAGCDSAPPVVPTPDTPAAEPAAVPKTQLGRPEADKPDLHRLGYDPAARTLTLYALPDRGGRWLLVTADRPKGSPVSDSVTLKPEAAEDLDRVSVFYTLPNRRPSVPVTLREIVDANGQRASR